MSDEKATQNPIFAIILLIGVSLGLLPFTLVSGRPTDSNAKPATSETSKGPSAGDIYGPIRQDLGCAQPPCTKCPQTSVKHLIALIPDPDTDGQASTYDEFISVIERAASDCDHTYVGHYIPHWQEQKTSPQGEPRSSFHRVGSLVFRRNGATTPSDYQYLVVLMILESPIRGISIEAFGSAVKTLLDDKDEFCACPLEPIRVIGPTYSGTQQTLVRAINKCRQSTGGEKVKFRVVTGSATAMKDLAPSEDIKFFRTVLTVEETLLKGAVGQYLGEDWENLVVLAESETTFGKSAMRGGDPTQQPRVIVFPRQIAAVRSAYLSRLGSEQIKKSPFSSDRHLTNLDLTSDHRFPDIPQAASLKTSPVVNELVVHRLMDDLASGPAPYIAIIATDARDTVFLAELVKRTLPNSQLILIEPHILFARPEVAGFLRGALVASTYPLTSFTQKWTSPATAHSPIQFVSDATQGTFNAVVAQLGYDRFRDYASPDNPEGSHPPVWICTIGREGFWPVTTFDSSLPECKSASSPKLLDRATAPDDLLTTSKSVSNSYSTPPLRLPAELTSPILVLALISLLALFLTSKENQHQRLAPNFRSLISIRGKGPDFKHQRQIALAFAVFSVLMSVHLLSYVLNLVQSDDRGSQLVGFLVALILVMGGIVSLVIAGTFLQSLRERFVVMHPMTLVMVVVGLIATVIALWNQPTASDSRPWLLFMCREVSLLNGVSLMTPVFLLLFLFAVRSFTAICVISDLPPRNHIRHQTDSFFVRLDRDWSKKGTPAILVGLVLAVASVIWMSSHWVLPRSFVLTAVFFVLFAVMLHHAWIMTIRVLHRWKLARKSLSHLGLQPFLTALDRLPQQFSARLGLYLSAQRAGEWYRLLRNRLAEKTIQKEPLLVNPASLTEFEPNEELRDVWDKRSLLDELRHGTVHNEQANEDDSATGRLSDEVYAMDAIDRLNWLARRLRFALIELLYMLVGLLLVVCSFPVPGQPYWVALFVIWLTCLGVGFIWIVFTCERDEVLSRIANTQPNRLSWSSEMIKSLAAFLIPVGLAITTVFPEVYESLVIMLQPLWSMFVRN